MFRPLSDSAWAYARVVAAGPDSGLAWFPSLPPLRERTESWIHPALSGGLDLFFARRWYGDQNGRRFTWYDPNTGSGLGSVAACDAAGVDRLRVQTESHEGLGFDGDSHFQRLVSAIASSDLATTVERTVVRGTPRDAQAAIVGPVNDLWVVIHDSQKALEDADYPRIFGVRPPTGQLPADSGAIRCFPKSQRTPFPAPEP